MPSTPQEIYCKKCERRFHLFSHDISNGCPYCKVPASHLIPTFSVEYINHVRLKHPEKGIRSRLNLS